VGAERVAAVLDHVAVGVVALAEGEIQDAVAEGREYRAR